MSALPQQKMTADEFMAWLDTQPREMGKLEPSLAEKYAYLARVGDSGSRAAEATADSGMPAFAE